MYEEQVRLVLIRLQKYLEHLEDSQRGEGNCQTFRSTLKICSKARFLKSPFGSNELELHGSADPGCHRSAGALPLQSLFDHIQQAFPDGVPLRGGGVA
jgi:hypothetical protein